MRILLVEDDLALSHQIATELGNENFVCDAVSSTTDALARLRLSHYSVAILDHYLEDENTLFLASHLRLRHPDTKIITLTGSAVYAYGYGLDRVTTDFLLRKPTPTRDLVEMVRYLEGTRDIVEPPVPGVSQVMSI